MRKLLWLGVAAVFTGYCGVSYYACTHPTSALVQVATRLVTIGQQINPVVMSLPPVSVSTPVETVCMRNPVDETVPPADPTPVLERGTERQLVGFLDVGAPSEVAAPITVHVEEKPTPPKADRGGNSGVDSNAPGNSLDGESACPRVMPHATDEESDIRSMPHSEEGSADPYDPKGFTTSESKGSGASEENEPKGTAPAGSEVKPESKSSHDSHSRYMVCPYSGKCIELPGQASKSASEEKGTGEEKDLSQDKGEESEPEAIGPPHEEEEQEPVVPHKTKKVWIPHVNEETNPSHPDIDTMEYRRDDGNLNEYSSNGPY